jgi:microcystin-dependent protein
VSAPYLGQISIVSFDFAPKGWALCNGQTLAISQNTALFSLLGTTYGGNGVTNFQLPNLQGRVAMHTDNGTGFSLGQTGGEETHTLTLAEMPGHAHLLGSVNQAATNVPAANAFAAKPRGGVSSYGGSGSPVQINDGATPVGGGEPHENRQPFLTLTFVIALEGIFPSHN